MPAKINLLGRRFGRLTVVAEAASVVEPRGAKRVMWVCECDCGERVTIARSGLQSGGSTSCGCYRSEVVATKNTKHGFAKRKHISVEYSTWCEIIRRCTNENSTAYPYYGGRGITMCSRWRESFEAFLNDMGEKPPTADSIDRIDNEKGYEPGNCRWTTINVQANNNRHNVLLTYQGETLTMKQMWRKHFPSGLSYAGLVSRLLRGWPIEQALSLPPGSSKPSSS